MTTIEIGTLKRTELQAAACRQFGKAAAAWTGRATNEELREALASGEVPPKFANGKGSQPDLAAVLAAAINPLLQAQLDEARVMELIEARVAEVATFVEARLAERAVVTTFEVHGPDGPRINVGRTHRQFGELLSSVDAGCWPFLIGPAGSFKTSAAAKVAEALGRPFHMDSMSEGKTPFDLLGFNDATGKPVHTELRRAWDRGGVFLCDELDAGTRPAHDARVKTSHAPAPALGCLRFVKAHQGGSMTTTSTARFDLGRILATPGPINAMKEAGESPLRLLRRHVHGDFGDLHEDDVRANELAIRRGMRVLSAYVLPTEARVWVITEADRSSTTILLPEEY